MFGERLRVLRNRNRLTQEELAKILGVERSSVGKYESANAIPSVDVLGKIADYFSVSVDFLLGRSADPTPRGEGGNDIEDHIEVTLMSLESQQDGLLFAGQPLDDVTRELLASSLRSAMSIALKLTKNETKRNEKG